MRDITVKNSRDVHLRAEAGIVYPLVIKSPLFLPPLFSFVKRLSMLSFRPTILRRFFFSFSSFSTRAVSVAVAAFLIPLPEALGLVV